MPAGYIDEPTRKLLERLSSKARKAVDERDQAIMEAVEAGISLRTVARVVELAPNTVRNIAKGRRDELDGRERRKGNYPAGWIE